MMVALQVTTLSKQFISPRGDVLALHNVSFTINQGEFVTIVGPSGCGKSTLLRLIAGLLPPDSGQIEFPGWVTPPKNAMVFQDAALFPWMSVIDNVAFGLETGNVALAERQQRAEALLKRMGLAKFARHYPRELSGGMRQRAAIARALVTEPDILLLDEPFRALDAQTRLVMQADLLQLWTARPQTVLFVTHDIEEAILLGDRVLVMSERPGRILTEINVPLARPRDLTGRGHPEIEELRWHIWKMLEPAARSKLGAIPRP
jgi:ABC-type nitrate/sulfonate/bicarbonate transport system ATPase subunit